VGRVEEKKNRFMQTYAPIAFLIEKLVGISAKALLAQCALETDWGMKVRGNNLFGVKAKEGEPFVEFSSYEYDGKSLKPQVSKFKKYGSVCESILDYVRKIKEEGRYYNAWVHRDHPALYFEQLKNAGYATDPIYEEKCMNILRSLPEWEGKNG